MNMPDFPPLPPVSVAFRPDPENTTREAAIARAKYLAGFMAGLRHRISLMAAERAELVRWLHEDGMTQREIGDVLHISGPRVWEILNPEAAAEGRKRRRDERKH